MLVFEKFPFVDNFWLESQMDRSHMTIQSPMKSANSALRIFLQMQKLECSIYHNLFDNFLFLFLSFQLCFSSSRLASRVWKERKEEIKLGSAQTPHHHDRR